MKTKRLEPTRRLDIPYSLVQENLSVEIRRWTKHNEDSRFDIIFRTDGSYVSHSVSRKQLLLLKQKVNEVI